MISAFYMNHSVLLHITYVCEKIIAEDSVDMEFVGKNTTVSHNLHVCAC